MRQFLAQKWAFFVKPNQKKIMFVNIFWWNFESKIKRKWNFSELSIEVWRLDIPKNWFGIEIYRYFYRYICKNVPKKCIFSFNLSKIKNLETSEDFFGVQNWFLYPQKPNLGYRTILVKILKLYQLVEETKKPASSVCTSLP